MSCCAVATGAHELVIGYGLQIIYTLVDGAGDPADITGMGVRWIFEGIPTIAVTDTQPTPNGTLLTVLELNPARIAVQISNDDSAAQTTHGQFPVFLSTINGSLEVDMKVKPDSLAVSAGPVGGLP